MPNPKIQITLNIPEELHKSIEHIRDIKRMNKTEFILDCVKKCINEKENVNDRKQSNS